jgi:hypothetical protein
MNAQHPSPEVVLKTVVIKQFYKYAEIWEEHLVTWNIFKPYTNYGQRQVV